MVKKLLAVVLAAMMMCGVLAVGASAVSVGDFVKVERPAAFGAAGISAPVDAQGEDEDIAAILAEAETMFKEKCEYAVPYFAYANFFVKENAYKPGKTMQAFTAAHTAAVQAATAPKQDAISAFLKDNAAVKAAYANGTLKDTLFAMYDDFADEFIAITERFVNEYFITDVLVFSEEYIRLIKLFIIFENANLTQEQADEIDIPIANNESKIETALEEGNYKESIKLTKDLADEIERVLVKYGIITISNPNPNPNPNPEPSFIAKVWNFILKWFLFGWIWMKK